MFIDEFYPTIWEVAQAEKVFTNALNKEYPDCASGVISKETAIKLAIIAVWRAGREYQADKQSKVYSACGQM